MRWLSLPAVVLVASCGTLWENCTEPNDCTNTAVRCGPGDAGANDDAGCIAAGGSGPPTVAGATCASGGYCWEYPPSQGNNLLAVWGASSSAVWAVGEHGTIVFWDGTHWSHQAGGSPDTLNAVWGSGPDDVWAVGSNGAVRHYTNQVWKSSVVPNRVVDLYGVGGSSADDVWAVGDMGTIYHVDSQGTWKMSMASPSVKLRGVWSSGPMNAYAVGDACTIVKLYSGSMSLDNVPSCPAKINLLGVWGSDQSNVWAITDDTVVQFLKFNGTGWTTTTPMGSLPGVTLKSLTGTSPTDIRVLASDGTVHTWKTGWQSTTASLPNKLNALWENTQGDLWAVGESGLIVHGSNSTWSLDGMGVTTSDIVALSASGANAGVAVTADGSILTQAGAGEWDVQSRLQTNQQPITSAWIHSPTDIWAVGPSGRVLHWTGGAWQSIAVNTNANLAAVWGTSSTDIWAVGDGGAIINWDQTGMSTNSSSMPMTATNFHAVWASSDNDVWVVGEGGETWHRTGAGWARVYNAGRTLRGVWGNGSGTVNAVGSASVIVSAMAQSSNWTLDRMPDACSPTLNAVWTNMSGVGWAVGLNGAVLKKGSSSWTALSGGTAAVAGPLIDLSAVYGFDDSHVWIAGQKSAIFRYQP